MNTNDTELVRSILSQRYTETNDAEDAEIVMLILRDPRLSRTEDLSKSQRTQEE